MKQRAAVLDSTHRAYVNQEVYFFSDTQARRTFLKDPQRYCGTLTDPVNRVRFRPAQASRRFDYRGRPYFFSDDSTRIAFQAAPDSFALRR